MKYLFPILLLITGCASPCDVRNAPAGMLEEIEAECEAQQDEFVVEFAVTIKPQWWFDAGEAIGAYPEAYGLGVIGTNRPRLPTNRVLLSETAFEDPPRWRTLMCHEIQHLLGYPHECVLCEYDVCVGRD